MEPRAFCSQSNVVIVAGKGGVGKTTVAAALALTAARAGLRTLIVDVQASAALPALFGLDGPLGYRPVTLEAPSARNESVTGRSVTPDDALVEYLDDHGLRRISKRMSTTGTLELVSTAIPGIKDILVLGKVKQLEQAAAAAAGRSHGTGRPSTGDAAAPELIVVDAPAAGHAVTFLATARGLLDAIGVGPIRAQASDVLDLLADPQRCQVLLVTLPEETPVNEVVETGFHLEDRVGVKLGPVVVNGIIPVLDLPADRREVDAAVAAAGADVDADRRQALADAAAFRRHRQQLQAAQLHRLGEALPLPQLHLPFLWTTDLGRPELGELADALAARIRSLPTPEQVPVTG